MEKNKLNQELENILSISDNQSPEPQSNDLNRRRVSKRNSKQFFKINWYIR